MQYVWRVACGEFELYPLRALRAYGWAELMWTKSVHPSALHEAAMIINRHLRGERDVLLCQDELIEAGLAQWAKL